MSNPYLQQIIDGVQPPKRKTGNPYLDQILEDRYDSAATVSTLSNIPDVDEEQRKREEEIAAREKEQDIARGKAVSDLGLSKGSAPYAALDMFISGYQDLGSLGEDIAKDPLVAIGRAAKGVFTGATNTLSSLIHGVTSVEGAKSLGVGLFEGIVRPLFITPAEWADSFIGLGGWDKLSPEEKNQRLKETYANYLAFGFASKVAKMSTLTKVPEVAKKALGAKNLDELASRFTDRELLETMASGNFKGSTSREILRNATAGLEFAIPAGLMQGDTPEERFANATSYGIMVGTLGGLTGVGRKVLGRPSVEAMQVAELKTAARAEHAKRTAEVLIKGLPPIEGALTITQIASTLYKEPTNILPVVAENLGEGKALIIKDVPHNIKNQFDLIGTKGKKVFFYPGKENMFYAAAEGKELTPTQAMQFKEYGLFEGSFVDYNGKVMQVEGFSPKAKNLNLVSASSKPIKGIKQSEVTLIEEQEAFGTVGFDEFASTFEPDKFTAFRQRMKEVREAQVNNVTTKATSKGFTVKRGTDGVYDLVDNETQQSVGNYTNLELVNGFLNKVSARVGKNILYKSGDISNSSSTVTPNTPSIEKASPKKFEAFISRMTLTPPGLLFSGWQAIAKSAGNLFPESNLYSTTMDMMRARFKTDNLRQPINAELNNNLKSFFKHLQSLSTTEAQHTLLEDLGIAKRTIKFDEAIGTDPAKWWNATRPTSSNMLRVIHNYTTAFKSNGGIKAFDEMLKVYTEAHDNAINAGVELKNLQPELIKAAAENQLTNGSPTAQTEMMLSLHKLRQQAMKTGIDEFSMAEFVDLTRSKITDAPSLQEYAVSKGWAKNGIEIQAIKALDQHAKKMFKLGVEEGIFDSKQELNYYMPMIRKAENYDVIPPPQNKLLLGEDPAFVHAMHRTGLYDDYITDPVHAFITYTNRFFRKNYEREKIAAFSKEIDRTAKMFTVAKNKNGVEMPKWGGKFFKQAADHFLNEFQHSVPAEDLAAQASMEAYLKTLGVVDAHRAPDLARAMLTLSSTSLMGFSPIQGVRDASTNVAVYFTSFGLKATKKYIEKVLEHTQAQDMELRKAGLIPTELTRILYEGPSSRVPGLSNKMKDKIWEKYEDFGDLAFRATMQAKVYQNSHIATVLERSETFIDAYNKFRIHKNIDKFRSETGLDRYSTTAQNDIIKLVNNGEIGVATTKFGMYSGAEFLGWYGNATHPLAFSGKWGRLVGQYGQWPLWALQMMAQGASRGNAGVYARWAAVTGSMVGAGLLTGVNLNRWTLTPANAVYLGGPWLGAGITTLTAMTPGMTGDQARKRLALMNPFKQPKQFYLGVPFQIFNLAEGLGLFSPNENSAEIIRNNPKLAIAKILGFSITPWTEYGIDLTNPE